MDLFWLFKLFLFPITSFNCVTPAINITFFVHLPYDSSPYSDEFLQPAIKEAFAHLKRTYNGTGYDIQQMRKVFPSIYRCDQALSVISEITAKYYFDLVEGHPDTAAILFVTGQYVGFRIAGWLSVCLCQSLFPSVCAAVYVCLPASLCICLDICLSASSLSANLSVSRFFCMLSVVCLGCLSGARVVRLSVDPPDCLALPVC